MALFNKLNEVFGDASLPGPGGESKRAGSEDHYIIRGKTLTRVTAILDVVKSQHLLMWHAEEASMKAASMARKLAIQLHGQYGVPLPPMGDELLDEFDAKRSHYDEDPQSLLAAIMNWRSVMREPVRWRDFKGFIGSLFHSVIPEYMLSGGITPVRDVNYLANKAVQVCAFDEDMLRRIEKLRLTEEAFAEKVAYRTLPYLTAAIEFLDTTEPTVTNYGHESCCVNFQEGYAGSEDMNVVYNKRGWEKYGNKWGFPEPEARCNNDWKTSKSLSPTVGMQLAAYNKAPYTYLFELDQFCEREKFDGAVALHVDVEGEEHRVRPKVWLAPEVDVLYDGFLALTYFYLIFADKPRALRSAHPSTRTSKPKRGQRVTPPWEE